MIKKPLSNREMDQLLKKQSVPTKAKGQVWKEKRTW
jgi:hypothetical protein